MAISLELEKFLTQVSQREQELLDKVIELGTKHPNARYEKSTEENSVLQGCYYTKIACGPGHGCIVGQALQSLFPDSRDLIGQLDHTAGGNYDMVMGTVGLDSPISDKIRDIQRHQDSGKTWGLAIAIAQLE